MHANVLWRTENSILYHSYKIYISPESLTYSCILDNLPLQNGPFRHQIKTLSLQPIKVVELNCGLHRKTDWVKRLNFTGIEFANTPVFLWHSGHSCIDLRWNCVHVRKTFICRVQKHEAQQQCQTIGTKAHCALFVFGLSLSRIYMSITEHHLSKKKNSSIWRSLRTNVLDFT